MGSTLSAGGLLRGSCVGSKRNGILWDETWVLLRFSAKNWKRHRTASIVTAFAAASLPPCLYEVGWFGVFGEAPSANLDEVRQQIIAQIV
jgi:hypothetical protein